MIKMNQEKPSSLLYLSWLIAILLIPVLITQFFLISQLEMLKKDVSLLNVEVELLKNHRIAKRGVGSTVLDCSQCPGYPTKRRRKGYIDVQIEPPNARPTLASRRAGVAIATTVGPVGPSGDIGTAGAPGSPGTRGSPGSPGSPGLPATYSEYAYPVSYSSWYSYGPSYTYSGYGYPSYTTWNPAYATGDTAAYRSSSDSKSWNSGSLAGAPGMPGEPGEPGEPGLPGLPGSSGMPGEAGYPGMPGGRGSPGSSGYRGEAGGAGSPGSPGYRGEPGGQGSPGLPGYRGEPGGRGSPGSRGLPGSVGQAGVRGSPGLPVQRSTTKPDHVAWRGLPVTSRPGSGTSPEGPPGCTHQTCGQSQNDGIPRSTSNKGSLSYRSLDGDSSWDGRSRARPDLKVTPKMRGDLGNHGWPTGVAMSREDDRRFQTQRPTKPSTTTTTSTSTTTTTTTTPAPKSTGGPEVKKALILYKLEIRNYNVSDDTTAAPMITTTTVKPPDKPSGFDFMTSSKSRDYIQAYRNQKK